MMEIEKLKAAASAVDGVAERMRRNEEAAGFTPVGVGSVPWLSTESWHPGSVVSTDGKRVRLVALLAKRPGEGGLLRTVIGILAAGLTPVIVEPNDRLAATLKRWGWKRRRIGRGFESQNLWYPRHADQRR